MLKAYLLITWRVIKRTPLFSSINVGGLAVAIAVCSLIYLFIEREFAYDDFQPANVYSVYVTQYPDGKPDTLQEPDLFRSLPEGINRFAWLPVGLGPAMQAEIPGILGFCRFDNWGGKNTVKYGEKVFAEGLQMSDSTLFTMLNFRLLKGDPAQVLSRHDQVVITEQVANRIFGEEEPIGKTVDIQIFDKTKSFTVSGIAAEPPANSTFRFSIIVNVSNRPSYEESLEEWSSFNTPVLVALDPKVERSVIESRLAAFTARKFADDMQRNREYNNLPADAVTMELGMAPLRDVHLRSDLGLDQSTSPLYAYILAALGGLILLIACINYISLALTTLSGRVMEVGVRKVMGAGRKQLIFQFWGEAFLITLLAGVGGLFLAEISLPWFNELVERELSVSGESMLRVLGFLFALIVFISLGTGTYPAWVLSRFAPVRMLKGRNTYRYSPKFIKGLVAVQYALSGFLVVSALLIKQQMDFVTTKDLGFDQSQVLVVPTFTGYTAEGRTTFERFRQAAKSDPKIEGVAATNTSFNAGWSLNGFKMEGDKEINAYTYYVSDNYTDLLGMSLVEGEWLPPLPAGERKILVNEAFVREMGWESAVGKKVNWRSVDSTDNIPEIVGVVKDYHFLSLEHVIKPVILHQSRDHNMTTLLIKLAPGSPQEGIQAVEKHWKAVAKDRPFEYGFLEDDVARQYESYQRWQQIMTASTLLALLIASLGLFGLSGLNAMNRMKEIGIRKVLGATVGHLFFLLNRQTLLLLLLALAVAMPVGAWLMERWLAEFQYRVQIGWELFALAISLTVVVALATVSYQTIRAALTNPVNALRDE